MEAMRRGRSLLDLLGGKISAALLLTSARSFPAAGDNQSHGRHRLDAENIAFLQRDAWQLVGRATRCLLLIKSEKLYWISAQS
jgi:hypothetical protein